MDSDDEWTTSTSVWSINYRPRSPPLTPPRPDPITSYNIRYADTMNIGGSRGRCIDLAFILDCTGSMQRYIDAVRDHVIGICGSIRGEEGLSGVDDLRIAVVNYRDHPPQDSSYVYRHHPFTSDVESVRKYLTGLTASGGGDGPEAVTAGMAATLTELEWRREASKMVVLVADAPPHGIGENGDQIKGGDPDGHDPLVIARTMAQNGITFFMVACEDTLSGYSRAVDFFQAICNMTSGVMLPLLTADLLATTIVGSVLENMDMERLIAEIGSEVAQRIKQKGETMESVEEVAQELHEKLLLRNEQTKQVRLPEVYLDYEEAKKNVTTWMTSELISDARDKIIYVPKKRLTDKFKTNNMSSGYKYSPASGRLPPRRVSGAPPTPQTPTDPAASLPPTSPQRRVVSDFKAFGSSSSPGAKPLSVFGAPLVAPAGPGGGMFGSAGRTPALNSGFRGMRSGNDDDDEEDDVQPMLGREAISLDQARRIATKSVFRAGRLG